MTPFVVDANAINAFQFERISNTPGAATDAIMGILGAHCIALDAEKLCLQEWIDSAGGTFPFALADWVVDQIVGGGILYFDLAPNSCWKKLLGQGIPQKDHKWVRLAIGSGGKRIVTEDVDFFDPTKKKAPAAAKEVIKSSRTGPCARYLKKEFGVEVMCIRHVMDEL